jgi:hypothetical protein
VSNPPAAHAAESAAASPTAKTPVDEEEQLDDGLKRFGYLAGLARGCVVEAQRVDLERERREARREVRQEIREDYYDNYYRGGDRWYRDGRYWDRYEYERRYYRRRDRDDDDVLKGAVVGAAVVGVAVAIANSKDD